jgi:hypothetical protein
MAVRSDGGWVAMANKNAWKHGNYTAQAKLLHHLAEA